VDAHADVPVVEVALLRSLPIFEPLGPRALEALAQRLSPLPLAPGDALIEQGQAGRRYYVVADGTLEVTRDGASVTTVGRGDGVGEISLLREVPCTATVRAAGTALVYAMEAEPFVEAVRCHPASGAAAERLVRERQPPIENIDSRSCWEKTSKATIV
jgi:CRP-like cAMP-binding protein